MAAKKKTKRKAPLKKRGRKAWKATPEQLKLIEEVAKLGGSKHMASILCGVSWHVMEKNYADLFDKKDNEGKKELLELQHDTAKAGIPTMQIWLGKQRLGQVDKQEINNTNTTKLEVHVYTPTNGRGPTQS